MTRVMTLFAWMLGTAVLAAQLPDIGAPPGRLIDVGGRKLHFICTGTGSPTVVIEAGASSFALDFSLVQPEVAKTNRICSYDRAGLGWSDRRDVVDTPTRIVADLHGALRALGEQGPFIMVGASWGGLFVRLYQLEYPADVAGLVLVDPSSEDGLFTKYEDRAVPIASLTAEQLLVNLPSSGSVPIQSRPPQTGPPFDRLSKDLYELRVKLDQRLIASMPPTVPAEIVREYSEGERSTLARLMSNRSAPDNPMRKVPVVVLTRGLKGPVGNHATIAGLSSNSRHSVVPDAGHEIHLFAPAWVIQAIQDVAAALRQGSQLPPRP